MDTKSSEFGPIRSILWPIHRTEFKKVLSMLLLFFFLCIAYSILRNLKDTVILTAKASGAEVIPFIKVWGMLPAVIIGTWVYTQLCSRFRRDWVFYILLSSFLAYFLLFAFVLYPHSESLHFHKLSTFLNGVLPSGFKGLIAMICNWTFTSFYIISELWSVLVLSILFWGFANDTTSVKEATRSYGILNIGSNVAPILGGSVALFVSNNLTLSFLTQHTDAWGGTIIKLILMVVFLGILSIGLYYWIHKNVVKGPSESRSFKGRKKRLSIRESIRYLLRSKYLTCIALIVLGYNISINLTDILWKEQLKRFFSDPNEMLEHMNLITVGIGIIATQGAIFFSVLVRKFGWTFIAILTPLLMTMMAIGFFAFLFCGSVLSSFAFSLMGVSPLAMTVYFGSLQNCLSKAGKYSVFDASKELAFLPLDQEAKLRGKAAIDGLGSGIGKSGASLAYQSLLIVTGGIAFTTPYIAIILACVFSTWIYSVVSLGKQFKKESGKEDLAAVSYSELVEGS